jgi:hypothetical protein
MSFLAHVWKNRTSVFSVPITEANGTTAVTLQENDVVRIKIGKVGDTPVLDLESSDNTENGSSLTFTPLGNTVTVTLRQEDTNLLSVGAHDCEVGVVDASELDAFKHAESGVIFCHGTQGGNIGEEQSSSSSS